MVMSQRQRSPEYVYRPWVKEPLKIPDGTVSLKSKEGMGSSFQVRTALTRKKRDVGFFETYDLW